MASSGPIETKVKASTAGAVVTAFVLWLLDTYVFVTETVPQPVELLVDLLVIGLVTFAAGWAAKHTPRRFDVPPTPPHPTA